MSTKLETDMAYEKVVIWWVKNLCFHMAHDYQTHQDDGLWHWATIYKVSWFFDQVIIFSLMTNKKRHISNTTNPRDTTFKSYQSYPIKSNQIYVSITVCSMKYLPPKIGG